MARPTDDPKHYRINLRVNKEMNEKLNNLSRIEEKSVAEYVRGLLENKELERYKQKFSVLSTRVRKEAHEYFQNEQYTALEIVPIGYCDKQSECGSIPKNIYDDLMSMVKTFGMTYEQFMTEIDRFLNDGYIVNDCGSLKTIDSKLDTSEFVAKCEELGIKDYQSMFDRIVKQIKVN